MRARARRSAGSPVVRVPGSSAEGLSAAAQSELAAVLAEGGYALHVVLDAELAPGERLVWAGRPDARRARIAEVATWAPIAGCAVLLLGVLAATIVALLTVSSNPELSARDLVLRIAGVPLTALLGTCTVGVGRLVVLPKRLPFYLLTDRRALTLTVGHRRCLRQIVEADALERVTLDTGTDGGGSLIFHARNSRMRDGKEDDKHPARMEWQDFQNPREMRELVLKTLRSATDYQGISTADGEQGVVAVAPGASM